MLTSKGLLNVEELHEELRSALASDEGRNFRDGGLNDWRKQVNTFEFCGKMEDGYVDVMGRDGVPIKIEHIEDGDVDMLKGCMEEYLIARGFKKRER